MIPCYRHWWSSWTSLCHYSGTSIGSKTLRKDVRDTKAWELLAKAQMPRKTRDVASQSV